MYFRVKYGWYIELIYCIYIKKREEFSGKRWQQMDQEALSGQKVSGNIYLCPDGKYRWIYEFPMLKNPAILITVFKVLGLSALIVAAFGLILDLAEDGRITPAASGEWKVGLYVLLFLIALVIVSYLILAANYGWKYIVLFEMDEKQVVHIQMPKQFEKAQALGWLTAMAGLATGRYGTAGTGMLAASRNASTSVFAKVRKVIGSRRLHLIRVNQLLERNQVYVEDADYEFVWNYITERCAKAKKR